MNNRDWRVTRPASNERWLMALAASALLLFGTHGIQAAETAPATARSAEADALPGAPRALHLAPDALLPAAPIAPVEPVAATAMEEEEEVDWSFSLEASAGASGGNTNKQDVDVKFEAKRVWKDVARFDAFIRAEWGQAKDTDSNERERTVNRQTAGATYRRYFDKPWYWFLKEGLEKDEESDIRVRSDSFAGIGTVLVENEKHLLAAEVGAGYTATDFYDEEDDGHASALLSEIWNWDINEDWDLEQKFELISNLEEVDDDFRTQFNVDATTDITENMFLSLGFEHRYNAEPAEDTKRQDYVAKVSLGIKF